MRWPHCVITDASCSICSYCSFASILLLYATRLVLVNYFSKHCQYNPQPAKLLLLAEAVKLVLTAVELYAKSFSLRNPVAKSHHGRPQPGTATATAAVPAAAALHITSLLKLSIPAFCYFCSNNLLFFALKVLPLHGFVLLCNLTIITTAGASSSLLQQRFSRQAHWSLLLLLAAILTGHWDGSTSSYAASSSSSSSSSSSGALSGPYPVGVQRQQQLPPWIPSWALGLLLLLAIGSCSAVGSITSELILTSTQQQQQQPPQATGCVMHLWHAARLYCWGVLLNGLWLWRISSSSALLPTADAAAATAAAAAGRGGGGSGVAPSRIVQWGCPLPALPQPAAAAVTGDRVHLGFFSDMGVVHWILVGVFAALGLLSGQVIRQQGSMYKAYIASLSMLLVAAVSHLVEQQQHPMLLYYVACCVAAAAVMHLQQQQHKGAQTTEARKAFSSSQGVPQQLTYGDTTGWVLSSITWLVGATSLRSSSSSGGGGGGGGAGAGASAYNRHPCASSSAATSTAGGQPNLGWAEKWAAVGGPSSEALVWLVGFTDRLAAAVVLLSVLLLLSGALPSSSGSSSGVIYLQRASQNPHTTTAAPAQAAMYNTTDVPMPQELISMPCIDGTWLQRDRFCPVVNCSLEPDCTVSDPSCCAHLNFRMLSYLDHLLTNQGLSQHYVIVYGTLLGAVRNKTILAHTNDVDVAMSAVAIAFLTQRSTQLELWRRGYVLWCSDNVWRLCAHRHHPLTTFQRLMRPGQQHTLQGGPYADVYLMWPSDAATAVAVDTAAAAMHSHTAAAAAASRPSAAEAATLQQQAVTNSQQHSAPQHSKDGLPGSKWRVWGSRRQEWQLCFSSVPVRRSGRKRMSVEGLRLVVPDNSEQLLQGTYGPRWRTPNLRPYAPSYDEDECVEKVKQLNATLYHEAWYRP